MWEVLTFNEKALVISFMSIPFIMVLMRPIWLNHFEKLPLQDLPIRSATKEQKEERLTKQLFQFQKIDKYLSVIVPAYIPLAIVLLFMAFSKETNGFWIIFAAISCSLAIGSMIGNKIIIRTHEIVLERYCGPEFSNHEFKQDWGE